MTFEGQTLLRLVLLLNLKTAKTIAGLLLLFEYVDLHMISMALAPEKSANLSTQCNKTRLLQNNSESSRSHMAH